MTRLWRLSTALAVTAALVAAGCGSDDDGSNTSTSGSAATSTGSATTASDGGGEFAEIKTQVEELQQRPTEIPQTEPVEGEIARAKTIAYLDCGVPACVILGEYLTEATDAVGWKTEVINQGGTPESVKAAWGEAIRRGPDAIVTTGGFPHEIFGDELAQAKKQGIPVIGHSEAVPADPAEGFIAMSSGPERNKTIGEQEANWIIAHTDGDTNTFFVDSGFPINTLQLETLTSTFKSVCPDTCKVESFQAPIESIGKDLAGKVASQLQANPDVDTLVPAFGDMAVGVPAALAGAGVAEPAMVTQEPGAAVMGDIRDGKLVSFNGSGPESMWGIVDVLIRYYNDEPYPSEVELPQWWITQDNAPSEDAFPAVEDYQAQFKELWGIE